MPVPYKYMNDIKHRKPNRLKKYNYSDAGWYFITICTQNMECLFGNIINNEMNLNMFGGIVKQYWSNIQEYFVNVESDEYVIMPNHVHGIIVIRNEKPFVGNDHRVVPFNNQVGHDGPTLRKHDRQNQLLFRIVQWFKTITTNVYIKGVKNNQFSRFNKRIWQKSFYEHIIRNELDLFRIGQYMRDNPLNWDSDRNNLKIK